MKNATDHKEDLLSTEKVDEASDTNSESSVVSMETATIELDAESAAATLLNPQEEEGEWSELVARTAFISYTALYFNFCRAHE